MASEERKSNFELMRIFLMLLVVMGHVTMYSNRLQLIGIPDYFISNIARSFSVFAVNTFVIISGYFGIHLRIKKLVNLDLRVVVYTWIGFACAVLTGIHEVNLLSDIKLLLPVLTKQYWYVTIYFVLCIISPLLNRLLKHLSEKELKIALVVGGIVFYVVATGCYIINANQIVTDAGYGIVNFTYLYMLGYYIRHYYVNKQCASRYAVIYLLAGASIFLANHGMTKVMGVYFNSMISYNTIFTLVGAVAIFMFFKNIKIGDVPALNKLASKAFAVYIIHTNPCLNKFIYQDMIGISNMSGYVLVIAMFALPIATYAVCFVIDSIMDIVLRPVENCVTKKLKW